METQKCGNEIRKELPVGVFDSGVGGISVLKEMVRMLPAEDFLYYGDSANAPYGTKPVETIREMTLEKSQMLYDRGIKALVIACNTATSAAIGLLREHFTTIPVIGIEPAVKPATLVKDHPSVLVLATPTTVHGDKFLELASRFEDKASILPLSCPGLMEFVEQGELESGDLEAYLKNLLSPVLEKQGIDVVVLGCTHYPFVRESIKTVLHQLEDGRDVPVIDGSLGTAKELRRRLGNQNLLREDGHVGEVKLECSLPEKEELMRLLFEA